MCFVPDIFFKFLQLINIREISTSDELKLQEFMKRSLHIHQACCCFLLIFFISFAGSQRAMAQLSGVKSVGGGSADYASLSLAIAALNAQGVGSGGVVFLVNAGHQETASNLLITASGTQTDSIVFRKTGTGADPLIIADAGTGQRDGIIKLRGVSYITFDGIELRDTFASGTQTTRMEWGFALLRQDSIHGLSHINIRNCVIGLQGANPSSVGIYAANHADTSFTKIIAASASGTNSSISILQNTFSNCFSAIRISGDSNALYKDEGNAIAYNTITNFGGDSTISLNVISALHQRNINISNNTITGSGIRAKDIFGVYTLGASGTLNINNNLFSVSSSQPASGRQVYGINNGTTAAYSLDSVYMDRNVIRNCTVTGTFVGIGNSAPVAFLSMSGDSVYAISMLTANGFSGLSNGGGTTAGTIQLIRRNVIYNITGLGGRTGIYGNTSYANIDSNRIYNLSSTSSYSDVWGILYGTYSSGFITCIGNEVYAISGAGYYVAGIKVDGGTHTVKQNLVHDISSGVTVTGIWPIGNQEVAQNKIYNLYSTAATDDFGDGLAAAAVVAIHVDAGVRGNVVMNIHNNLISSLHSPASVNGHDIRAIVINTISGDTAYVAYNTVYLDAKPTSSNWGSSVLYHSPYNTLLKANNNIFVNTSESKGGGTTSVSRAYNNATLPKYATSSNNNLFYAGIPSARNLIYFDGSARDSMLYMYQLRVGSRADSLSFSEMPVFVDTVPASPGYLKINPLIPTQIESGGASVKNSKGDFLGSYSRHDTLYPMAGQLNGGGLRPDVGAFEGDYTPAPVMVYVSGEVMKSGGNIFRNVVAQQMQRIMIVTTGQVDRLRVDSLLFSTGFTTSNSDIANARVYYTVNRNNFDTSLLYGYASPNNGTITIKGNARLLSADTNYFWLAYDISASATPGNTLDGVCTDIYLSSGVYTPAVVNPGVVKTIPLPLSGNYQVGSGRTYNTITAAVTALNTLGISSSVSFELMDAVYNTATGETFPLRINSIIGTSLLDTILFKPTGTTNVSVTANNGPAFILNGADHIKIDGTDLLSDTNRLSITGTNAAIWVQNSTTSGDSCLYNTFRRLNISASTIGIGISSSVISTSGNGKGHHYNSITDCKISDAGIAIFNAGASVASKSRGCNISGNNITKGGILVAYQDSMQIINNKIRNITSTTYGISLGIYTYASYAPGGSEVTNTRVSANEIWGVVLGNSASVGIGVAPATSGINIIDNNLIYDIRSNGTSTGRFATGMYLGGGVGSVTKVYFNTMILKGVTTRTTPCSYGIAIGGTDPSVSLFNNIFYNTQTAGVNSNSYAIGMSTAVFTNLKSNNNVYYTSGANAVFAVTGGIGIKTVGTVYADLTAWKAATLQDTNSLSLDPVIDSASGFKPNILTVMTGGKPVTGFETDKAGLQRNTVSPTIGAYEVFPVYDDAGVQAATVVNNDLHVRIRNFGDNPVYSIVVSYSINNGTPASYPTSLVLPPRDTITVILPSFTIPNGINTLKVYSSMPNSSPDTNPANDTIVKPLSYPLAGTYTIGGVNPDYATISAAVDELNFRGISAPVLFNIRSGVYNEQAEIRNISGASAAVRVTFTSEAGHADSVNITYAASVPAANYVIRLASASFITFNKLTLTATGSNYGGIIELLDSASYDSIGYCKLTGKPVIGDYYYHALVFGNGCYGHGNVIHHNSFINGARGIYYNGVVDFTRNIFGGNTNVIEYNTFSGVSTMSVYARFTVNIRINRNVITSVSGNHYGITLESCDSAIQVTGNKINIAQGGFGLQIQYSKGSLMTRGIVASNEICVGDGDGIRSTANGGAYEGGVYRINYYHNTVKVAGANSYAAIFDLDNASWFGSGSNTYVDVKNNVFANTGGGFAIKAPLKNAFVTHLTIDNNSLYTNGTYLARKSISTNYVHDTLYADLAAWRRATPYDAHSFSHRPVFSSATDLTPDPSDTLGWILNGRGQHLDLSQGYISQLINKDVNGNARATTYAQGVPDIGAHEFTPVSLPPLAKAIPAHINGYQPVDTTQLFMFYDDTVAAVTWKANLDIPALEVRQYSGVIPVNVSANDQFMYFYTSMDTSGTNNYFYDITLFYRENWRGTIAQEADIRLAKKEVNQSWNIPNPFDATNDTLNNTLTTAFMNSFGLFSGTDLNNPMPVRLLSFGGTREKSDARLTWETASEINNKGFEIQRSADGKRFDKIGFVAGNGNANNTSRCTFTDRNVFGNPGQVWYYRLRQVDLNGRFDYSATIILSGNQAAANNISVFPNPFGQEVFIRLTTVESTPVSVAVYDLTGKPVLSESYHVKAGEQVLHLTSAGSLESGVYYTVVTAGQQKQVMKLVKQ
jgi:hypothetical protein